MFMQGQTEMAISTAIFYFIFLHAMTSKTFPHAGCSFNGQKFDWVGAAE